MLHIILLILKLIGIVLLVLLGVLLLLILTVLLVPIRYKVAIEHGEVFRMEGRAGWLLHLINAKITHIEGKLHIRVRILWFRLYDNLEPRPIKEKAKKSKKKKSRQSRAKDKETYDHSISSNLKEKKQELIESSESQSMAADHTAELVSKPEKSIEKEAKSSNLQVIEDKADKAKDEKTERSKKKSIIRRIIEFIKNIKDRIYRTVSGIKNKLLKLFESVINIKHKVGLITTFIKDEVNREGFKLTYASLKRLLKHILPRKLQSKIVFGTGDPCSTGQALGAMSILYSFYGDKVQITPDFENKRFEGKHFAKGRIRLVTILIIVIKLIIDERFKQLKRNVQLLKEAL